MCGASSSVADCRSLDSISPVTTTHPESSSAAVISVVGVFAGYRGINIRLFTSAINVRKSEMQVVEV
jgi:hypothetical protein